MLVDALPPVIQPPADCLVVSPHGRAWYRLGTLRATHGSWTDCDTVSSTWNSFASWWAIRFAHSGMLVDALLAVIQPPADCLVVSPHGQARYRLGTLRAAPGSRTDCDTVSSTWNSFANWWAIRFAHSPLRNGRLSPVSSYHPVSMRCAVSDAL
eukprot:COSAG06_NODE_19686_length_826_cov_14.053645_1_plen_154_part_00